MNKSELIKDLQDSYQQWAAFMGQIDPAKLDEPGVAGHWSVKDIVAHMNGWQRRNTANIQATIRNEPKPASVWPADLKTDDDVNGWLYETNRNRPARDLLDESQQVNQELIKVLEDLPDDIEVAPAYHIFTLNGQRFSASEFFDHFHNDHEADIRTWLAQKQ